MNGFIAEKKTEDGKSFWVVKDVNTKVAIAVGNTVTQAVENYEIAMAHNRIIKGLGANLDDLSF